MGKKELRVESSGVMQRKTRMKAFEKLLSGSASPLTGYYIGCSLTLRNEWMQRAREADGSDSRQMCVRVARGHNRQMVRQMRLIRP